MRHLVRLCAVLSLALAALALPTPALAAGDIAALARRAASGRGADYLTARRELMAVGADSLVRHLAVATTDTALAARLAVAAALVHLQAPAVAARLDALRGLDPGVYRLRRRPEPEVGRELRRLDAPAALLIERFVHAELWTSTPAERQALREGVLVALEASEDPLTPEFLRHVLDGAEPTFAALAASSLGSVARAGAVAPLTRVAHDRERPVLVRVGALRGLGRTRDSGALAGLEATARGADVRLARAAVAALGQLGSATVVRRHGGDRLGARAGDALARALAVVDPRLYPDVVEAIGVVAHAGSRAQLEALTTTATAELRAAAEAALMRLARASTLKR